MRSGWVRGAAALGRTDPPAVACRTKGSTSPRLFGEILTVLLPSALQLSEYCSTPLVNKACNGSGINYFRFYL